MGCDPVAKLFFGIIPDIDDDFKDKIDFTEMEYDWEKRHIPQPDVPDRGSPAWDQWRLDRKQWIDTSPLSVEHLLFGYDGNLRDALCCSRFYYESEWDEVTMIPNQLPTPSQEYIDGLKAFCDHFGIPWQEPQWHLVSLYF